MLELQVGGSGGGYLHGVEAVVPRHLSERVAQGIVVLDDQNSCVLSPATHHFGYCCTAGPENPLDLVSTSAV